ncbi:MAG: SDR family oxidoreductase [Alphaproteobacteria bacterium]|nr:SDR family oxidoreductase [Alphaproteobacteria bacterium]
MRILVTGAAGFIGSHLTRTLLDSGHEVVGLDDLSSGHRSNLPVASPGWRFVLGDIRDPAACTVAMQGVQAVMHLAGRNSVPRSLADPFGAVQVNVAGSVNLLDAARVAGVRRFVYASSSSVYGDDPTLPKVEHLAHKPLSPYAASKASLEHLARAWSSCWGLHTLGLRFFNVFGPRQDPRGPYAAVVPRFVEAALEGHRPTIHGDGSATRDFTYVDNATHALVLALRAPEEAAGEAINVACGGRVSVLELWRGICAQTGFDEEPHFGPVRPGDMPHSHADIGQARRLLGFEPQVGFPEGIQRTVAWYRQQRAEVAHAI